MSGSTDISSRLYAPNPHRSGSSQRRERGKRIIEEKIVQIKPNYRTFLSSRKIFQILCSVIPAEAGIQFFTFQEHLDSGFHRSDGILDKEFFDLQKGCFLLRCFWFLVGVNQE